MKTNFKMNVLTICVLCTFLIAVIMLVNRDLAGREKCEQNKQFYFHGRCF
jgi:hypothetical protein